MVKKQLKKKKIKQVKKQETRNSKTLDSFIKYCVSHPNERFFQALRNWFGYPYIGVSNDRVKYYDTFYLEEGIDYEIK